MPGPHVVAVQELVANGNDIPPDLWKAAFTECYMDLPGPMNQQVPINDAARARNKLEIYICEARLAFYGL